MSEEVFLEAVDNLIREFLAGESLDREALATLLRQKAEELLAAGAERFPLDSGG
jgi:hypothetical protein